MLEVSRHLQGESVCEAREEASAAREDYVADQHLTEVEIALADGAHDQIGDGLGQVRVRCLCVCAQERIMSGSQARRRTG